MNHPFTEQMVKSLKYLKKNKPSFKKHVFSSHSTKKCYIHKSKKGIGVAPRFNHLHAGVTWPINSCSEGNKRRRKH